MFLVAHATAGAALQKVGGNRWWAWGPLSLASHYFIDRANWGAGHLWHGNPIPGSPDVSLPMDFAGILVIILNVVVMVLLLWKARQYWLGMTLACIIDLDHLISPLFGYDAWFHRQVLINPWLETEWSIFVQIALVVLAVALVIPPIRRSELREAPSRMKDAVVRVVNGVGGYRPGATERYTSADKGGS